MLAVNPFFFPLLYQVVLGFTPIQSGLLILLFATIGKGTSLWLVVPEVFFYGFFTSLQYTCMNTLVYADVSEEQASSASSVGKHDAGGTGGPVTPAHLLRRGTR